VFLWFIATSVLTIFFVFGDPNFDYRPLVAGALLPDVVDGMLGGARYLHSLSIAVGLMALVMVATAGRRPIRRRLLGVPIGMLLHIVFDAGFDNTRVFWWPFTGAIGSGPLPIAQRGLWNVPLELIGAGLILWSIGHFGLRDPGRRRQLVSQGRLSAATR
jgi:hypothetical protein